ncbi:MAG: DUF6498-containing protein [Thermoplasmatota archaeon]
MTDVAVVEDPDAKAPPPASLWFLLAANVVPLVGVLAFGWDLGLVLLLYWAESAVILFFSLVKLAITAGRAALALIPFFLVHAGMFMGGHLVFLLAIFVDEPAGGWLDLVRDVGLVLPVFVVSHGFSFVANFRRKGEVFKGQADVMTGFYKRIVVMHLTIIFGAFLMSALGSPVWALLLLIAFKTAIDGGSHLWERRRQAPSLGTGPPTPS